MVGWKTECKSPSGFWIPKGDLRHRARNSEESGAALPVSRDFPGLGERDEETRKRNTWVPKAEGTYALLLKEE